MSAPYRLYGAELSPYSQKVRAYLAYKNIPFEWLARTNARAEEFTRYAKLPLMPVLVGSDESVLQDSTPTIEALERQGAEPALEPADPALAFLSALLEDYADEWLNKAMFHYRWSNAADQESAARRLVDGMFDGDVPAERDALESSVRERMAGRLRHVGSNAETAPVIEQSFARVIALLDAHLASRSYVLGSRPSLADFGLAAQLAQLLSDPTPGSILRERAPRVVAWLERMSAPSAGGSFESLDVLRGTLASQLRDEVAVTYLPWMTANAEAVVSDANALRVDLDGRSFAQGPQRYAAKAWTEIKRKCAGVDELALASLLEETGCASYLRAAAPQASSSDEEGDDEGGEGDDEALD
jgi:glutathione S-transferase